MKKGQKYMKKNIYKYTEMQYLDIGRKKILRNIWKNEEKK